MKSLKHFLIAAVAVALSLPVPGGAAIASTAVWEVRTTGNDLNGGGYQGTGTDMSQFPNKNAAGCTGCQSATNNLSTTDAVSTGTAVITSATAAFTSALVGNIIHLETGSGAAITSQWRVVLVYTSPTQITLDAVVTASTGMVMNIGGSLASLGQACTLPVTGNTIYFQNSGSNFPIATATTNTPTGACASSVGAVFIGYTSNRTFGNTDTPPTVLSTVNSVTQIAVGGGATFYNFIFDGNGTASTANLTGSKLTSGGHFTHCTVRNFNTISSGNHVFYDVYITLNTATSLTGSGAYIEAYNNTATPINGAGPYTHILTYGNTGATTDGISISISNIPGYMSYITSVGNGRYGIITAGSGMKVIQNSILMNNANVGLDCTANNCFNYGVAFYGNNSFGAQTAVAGGAVLYSTGTPTITADPFTNTGGNVYTLNNLVGAGAVLRAAGLPTTFRGGLTADSQDIGAAHIVPNTSGGGYVIVQ